MAASAGKWEEETKHKSKQIGFYEFRRALAPPYFIVNRICV